MTLSIKKTLIALAFSSLAMSPLHAKSSETNIKEVRNEVGIMLNILQTSLKQQSTEKNIRFRAESVFYLADQGVVFQIDSGRHGGNFLGFDLGGLLSQLPKPPKAPKAPKSSSFEINIDDISIDENEIERMVMNFVEHGDHYDDDISDKMRDLSEEQRELGWEKREYERSRRDLEFEKRNADSNRRKEIDKRLAEFNKEVAKLEAKTAELEKFRNELESERNQEIANRQAVKKKLYSESLALFEDTIGDMLCNYGAGLRSLADEENITFLLSDFVDADDDSVIGSHDKVYVFKHKDVKACVTGKSNKNKLLTAAKTYLF
jgi:DNA repair exonuclease SbcCD ATPase subunit